MRALRRGVRLALCAGAVVASQTAAASDLAPKVSQVRMTSDWIPMFGDQIDSAIPPTRGVFKISENESPRPADRVFVTYNYFNNVNNANFDVHRQTIGFEKAFFDGNASFGVRLPFLQFSNQDGGETLDLSLIFKYALINTPSTVLSTGLVVTVPTGSLILTRDLQTNGDVHPAVFQPFFGVSHYFTPDFFVQGFSSVAVPSDDRDVTMFYNSLGAGYWIYRGPPTDPISGVVPMFEVHVNTPLNKQDFGFPDRLETIVNLTGGVRIELFRQATLGIAVGAPVTGPKVFDIEALAQLNLRF